MSLTKLKIKDNIKITQNDALLIVDMQYDFMPGGSLPIKEGDKIIGLVNQLGEHFNKEKGIIILTQDWHPPNHLSFASNHPNKSPGEIYQSKGIGPVLWPDHCVQGTNGASFHKNLRTDYAKKIFRKGIDSRTDSYSAFRDQLKDKETGLREYLIIQNIKRVFICGLALDYCCYYTAMDGIEFSFDVFFIIDATKGVDVPKGHISSAIKNMKKNGVKFVNNESFQ
ncbi:MAG: bifunctional nicotinamidase/pyrazinamidase [Candidatus Lokiarchaeota archaeon]|nr:bifunctional nicotinamidase/pyrazinamidase [Candidatus Lokiarchaeota archaeon]